MTTFDVVLLIVAVPMFLLNFIGYTISLTNPLVAAGLAKPKVKPKTILMWLACILLVLYRVCG